MIIKIRKIAISLNSDNLNNRPNYYSYGSPEMLGLICLYLSHLHVHARKKIKINRSGIINDLIKSFCQQALNIVDMNLSRCRGLKSWKLWTSSYYNVNYTPYEKVDNSEFTKFKRVRVLKTFLRFYSPLPLHTNFFFISN